MTIREIEEGSGLTRANIRFYEAEGLLHPTRRENGYRDYTQEDLRLLLKIKLLRALRVPLETIKALEVGKLELGQVLQRQLAELQQQELELSHARTLCAQMYSDGARFDTLDAERYLSAQNPLSQRSVPEADRLSPVRAPWRRYFARWLDLLLYGLVWTLVLCACKVNLTARGAGLQLLDSLVTIVLMLAIEPLLLSRFGTTVGKWVFGLGVSDPDGGRLSYRAAYERLKWVIWRGYGLFLPIYNLIRLWKSYKACADGQPLDWEDESALTLQEGRTLRCALGVAAVLVAAFGLTALGIGYAELPRHRGEISVAEFCENYNQLTRYYDAENLYRLDAQGEWVERETNGSYTVRFEAQPRPVFLFTEEDGEMTGLSFAVCQENSDAVQGSYWMETQLAMLAFVRAQPGGGIFSREVKAGLKQMETAGLDDFSITVCGVTIARELRYSGYDAVASLHALWPVEGEETSYEISFTMHK